MFLHCIALKFVDFLGAIYGVFVGIIFLRNLIVKRYERYIWWGSVAFVSLTLVIMIIINLMYIFETN